MSHILRVFCYTWCKNLIKCVRVRVINNQATAAAPAPGNLWSPSRCCMDNMDMTHEDPQWMRNYWGSRIWLSNKLSQTQNWWHSRPRPSLSAARITAPKPSTRFPQTKVNILHAIFSFVRRFHQYVGGHFSVSSDTHHYCGRTMTRTMLKMPKFKILATGENENHLNVPISGCKLWSQ